MTENDAIAPPVFVTGFGRSGTTLCGEILNAHSTLAIAEETSFPAVTAFGLKNFRFAEPRRAELERTLLHLVYRAYAASQGKPRFGDKVLGEIDALDAAFEGMPRYVWMVRHPIDVAESWTERFSLAQTAGTLRVTAATDDRGNGDAVQHRRIVLRAVEGTLRYLGRALEQRGLGQRIIVCRYEDLATTPEQTVRRICEFVGVEYEAPMLDGARFGARGIARGDTRRFRSVIDDHSVARWQKLPAERRSLYASLRDEVRAALEALAAAGVAYDWGDLTS